MDTTNGALNRKLRMALVGGGQGAFIGRVHATAAILDNRAELVAGASRRMPRRPRPPPQPTTSSQTARTARSKSWSRKNRNSPPINESTSSLLPRRITHTSQLPKPRSKGASMSSVTSR